MFLYSAIVNGRPSSPTNSFSARMTVDAGLLMPAAKAGHSSD